jgi:NAD(P)-dependent dehydrogenase (short-subunit alcohol dehydrogenase family)
MGVQAITRLRRSADRSTWHRVDLTEGLAMILVTGATGTVGRPLIELLASEGVKVRAVTHNPQAAGLPAGIEIAGGDLSRPDTITPLLEGVTGLFLHPRAVGIPAAGKLLALAMPSGSPTTPPPSARPTPDPGLSEGHRK